MSYSSFLLVNVLIFSFLITSGLSQSNGEVRLVVDGLATGSYTSGRVQVYYSGQWGNICGSGTFGITEANVICHQLGYDQATSVSTGARDIYGIDDHPPLLHNVTCNSNDSLHILQCVYNSTAPYCDNNDKVSVVCSLTPVWNNPYNIAVRLVAGGYPSYGRLETYESNQWRTLCDNGFGQDESDTACRQLGYTYALQHNHLHNIDGTGPRIAQYTCCSSSMDCLRSCYCDDDDDTTTTTTTSSSFKRGKRIDLLCDHTDDVTLQCDFNENEAYKAGTRGECDNSLSAAIIGIILGSIFGGICLIVLCVIGWVAGCIFCNS